MTKKSESITPNALQPQIEAENPSAVICGIDEAGRGPLCGSVYAAAVVFEHGTEIEGLKDSKLLSEKKREELFDIITQKALSWAVAFATNEEIDDLNILNATFLAMQRAYDQLKVKPDLALIDGNRAKLNGPRVICVVKGDQKCISISAASILAKVSRDREMKRLSEIYPQYALDKHKGYPTKEHYELIKKYGICDIYRRSFLKNLDEH